MNFINWLSDLKENWIRKDIKSILDLFDLNVKYYESPFEKLNTLNDIKIAWEEIYNQNIESIEYNILGYKEQSVVANYILNTDSEIVDMVYEIELNNDNKCVYFKQWYMARNKNDMMINRNKLSVETYDKIAKKYDEEFGNDYSDTMYIDKFLKTINGKEVLDIGCGVGNLTNYIFEKGYNIDGIDLSGAMLNIAKNRYKGINFYKMDMKNITITKKYDGIMLAYSLFHLTKNEVKEALPKYYKLLNKDGTILLILQMGSEENLIDEPLENGLKMFINYYSLDEITVELNKNNFNIIYTDIKKTNNKFELGNDKLIIICKKG